MSDVAGEPRDVTRINAAILQLLMDGSKGRNEVAENVSRMMGIALSPSALLVMERLGLESMRVNDLGASVGISSGAITRQIQDLESKGLISRASDSTDRRAAIVRLSDRGVDVIRLTASLRDSSTHYALQDWTDEEVQQLTLLFERLVESLRDREYRAGMAERIQSARDITVHEWIRLIQAG